MRELKYAIIAAVAVWASSGAALAQSQSPSVLFGPESYRIGKGVIFTIHQKLDQGLDGYLVTAYLGACDGTWVSGRVEIEINQGAGDDLRAQQEKMLDRLQRPIDGSTIIHDWSDPGAPITGLRDRVMKLCKTARATPRNLLIPVVSAEELAYSLVSSTVTRKGGLVDFWSEMSSFREEPILQDGKPVIHQGKPALRSVFTGAKKMRRESINCSNRTNALSTTVNYEGGTKAPETINIPKNQVEFSETVPNSIGESMVDFVCKVF